MLNLFGGPKYDGKYLRSELGNLTMKQTLTHTLIPTFDIKRLQPIIFTTSDVRTIFLHLINKVMADIYVYTE